MNAGWLAAGALVACLASYGIGWEGGASHAKTTAALAASENKVADQTTVINQEQDARTEEERRHAVVEETSKDAGIAKDDAATAVAGADDAADRLRVELEAAKRRFASGQATCDTRVGQQRDAAQARYDLLARLYQESDSATGRLAAEAERYRIAGLACQAQYQGVRNSPGSIGE